MFKSARVKLTLFYLAAVIIVSLASTLGYRLFAESIISNSTSEQQGGLRSLIRREVGLPIPNGDLDNLRNQQLSQVRHQLDEYVLYINLIALVVGGVASYWFAGWTLRPIEDAHEAQARFASDASHELRTPLTAIRTENEVFLRQKSFTDKEAKDLIESNLEEVQRLEQIATNLLALTKYEGQEGLKITKVQAEDICREAIEQIKLAKPGQEDRVEVSIAPGLVLGNVESLSLLLSIFLDNAIKYSPKSKAIKLVGKRNGDSYDFVVEDQGPGIDPDDMPYVFERLYRSDKNRSKTIPGHGLGLSIAKEIAKANNAGLSVANAKGGGAQFTLSLNAAS